MEDGPVEEAEEGLENWQKPGSRTNGSKEIGQTVVGVDCSHIASITVVVDYIVLVLAGLFGTYSGTQTPLYHDPAWFRSKTR